MKLKKTLLMIDEVQNVVSQKNKYYEIVHDTIMNAPDDLRIVLLSATPIFDKPIEIGLTMNLLRPIKKFPVGKVFMETFIEPIKNKKGRIISFK